jgi:hypothetical protein
MPHATGHFPHEVLREVRGLATRASVLRIVPRLAILGTAIAELATGDLPFGLFCLVGFVLTLVPAIHARRLDAGIPLGLEVALLWLMVADMTLGNGLGLYFKVTWYDKALHFSSSVLIAMIGFLAFYVVHLTHETKFRPWLDGLAIFLVTLGIGALWELAEYAVDIVFTRRTQGAPNMGPLEDTMLDLSLDAIGGVLGAVLGPLYIRYSKRSRNRVRAFARMLAERTA